MTESLFGSLARSAAADPLGWETLRVLVRFADRLTGRVVLLDEVVFRGDVRIAPVEREKLVGAQLGLAGDLVSGLRLPDQTALFELLDSGGLEQIDRIEYVDRERRHWRIPHGAMIPEVAL